MVMVGIVSTGVYLPENFMSAKEISKKSGIPIYVVEKKLGIKQKPIPGSNDHTCEMGIKAAKKALDKAGLDPEEIDLIIYIGEEHKEYPLWTAALYMQHELKAVNAIGFDIALRCGTTIMALKIAKDMMLADEAIQTVLLAGGYRNEDFINYENPRTRFMFNLAAGGGAILLKKNYGKNEVLASHLITDGSFSKDVVVPAGGTKHPISNEALEKGMYKLDVLDSEGMKKRLEDKSMKNFLHAVRKSLQKSGLTEEDVNYLGILHM